MGMMRIMRMDGKESHTTFPHTLSIHSPRPLPQASSSPTIPSPVAAAIRATTSGTMYFLLSHILFFYIKSGGGGI